ncbi:MAG: nuclear transport factor 2 family protein [Thermoanaerobaculia bacterium]|nr:nuclear transport factor 2 family protein [Thermoanaerobaculia bacterium]
MTFRKIATFVIVSLGLAAALDLRADPNEEEGVRAAAGHYLKGHATGDPDEFRKAFHSEAKLFWIKEGALAQRTSADYIAGATGKPAADEAQRKRRIVSVDITGDTAVVKVELDYPNAFLTDYLSMLKIDGQWKIINKIFHARPKKTS